MSEYDSIQLGGTWLRPSPFVSTSYEYAKSGDYTIGGVLLVTLSGTLVAKLLDCSDILTQMDNIRAYNNDRLSCRKLIIGCSGDPTFLEGTGKIRSATATKGDQPCIATYNIVIAIETKANDRDPIIDPDPEFLAIYGLTKEQLKGVGKYEETLSLQGEASNLDLVTLMNDDVSVSKSYVKFNGKISISSLSGGKICGTNTNVLSAFITLIKDRYKNLMTASFASSTLYKKLSPYSGWNKWLDTNEIDIDASNGSVTWSFSLIMNKGSCKPMALVDINTTDAMDQKTKKKTRSIQGTINGLSISTDTTFLENGVSKTERISNAKLVFNSITNQIVKGTWPKQSPPTLLIKQPPPGSNKICGPVTGALCYQRMSSSNTVSPILGQISFSAEFQDIESTKSTGNNSITYSVDEKLSAWNIVEILIPAEEQSVIQQINTTPHTVIIEVMGQLSGCDNAKITETKCMVDDMFDILAAPYKSWLVIAKSVIQSQRSFRRRKEFLECDINNM